MSRGRPKGQKVQTSFPTRIAPSPAKCRCQTRLLHWLAVLRAGQTLIPDDGVQVVLIAVPTNDLALVDAVNRRVRRIAFGAGICGYRVMSGSSLVVRPRV